MRESCVIWTLKKLGFKSFEFEGFSYKDNNYIIENEKDLRKSGIILRLFKSIAKRTYEPKRGDIIIYPLGVGLYISPLVMYTLNIQGKEKYMSIPKKSIYFRLEDEPRG